MQYMADITFVENRPRQRFSARPEPLMNILNSICLLHQPLDNMSPWVDHTRTTLTEDELEASAVVCTAGTYVAESGAKDVPTWLEEFEALHPQAIAVNMAQGILMKARRLLPGRVLPNVGDLLSKREVFRHLTAQVVEALDKSADPKEIDEEFEMLQEPKFWQKKIVDIVGKLWTESLADEWNRVYPRVLQAVEAVNHLNLPESLEDKLKLVTGRDEIPETWLRLMEQVEEVIWVPSPHIGPYMILFHTNDTTAWFMSRARIPEGSQGSYPLLERSDLVIRLNALGDETRLQILEMARNHREITTQQIMDNLGITQSSASRHLSQLSATGLLGVDASEKTKRYRVQDRRIDDVLRALAWFKEEGDPHVS